MFQAVLNKPVKHNVLLKAVANLLTGGQLYPEEPAPANGRILQDLAGNFPMSILVAEDNLFNRYLIENILQKLGYFPEVADNGQEAINKLAEHPFDMVLMDVQMPLMDGLTATRLIRQETLQHQPIIIAMTAEAQEEDRQQCLTAGMNDYISKPLQLGKLVELLKKWAAMLPSKTY
jgi:CheY-like chemotaxis protein